MKKIPKTENIISAGDLNGKFGNEPIPEHIRLYGEQIMSRNGAILSDFCALNKLKIKKKTYFTDKKTYTNLLGRQEGTSQ